VPSTFALQLAALDLGKETLKVKQDEGGGSRPNFSSRRRLEIDFGTCLNNDMSNEHQDVTTILAYPCWDVQAEMGRLAVQLVAPFLSTKELINWRTAKYVQIQVASEVCTCGLGIGFDSSLAIVYTHWRRSFIICGFGFLGLHTSENNMCSFF